MLGVSSLRNGGLRSVVEALFKSRFEWFVDFDKNRAADGVALRREFAFANNDIKGTFSPEWYAMECSMLEMMVGLSKRMSMQTDNSIDQCFWHIMRNVGLSQTSSEEDVRVASEKITDRLYNYDGSNGGLFPLKGPEKDQRQVELLYQMYAYILENEF